MRYEPRQRQGYLTIDALVALSITTVAVAAAVTLASTSVARISQARDRVTAIAVADDLYEGLYAGRYPDGRRSGEMDGRRWTYVSTDAGTTESPSLARRAAITVERRYGADLVLDALLPPAPPAPDTASSSS